MKRERLTIYPEMPFNRWCVYWFDHTNCRRTFTTNAKYEEIITRVIQPYFKNIALSEVDTHMIQNFINGLVTRGLKESRVSMVRLVISAVMVYAVNHNLISRNPTTLAHSAKRKASQINILTDDNIRQLLAIQDSSIYISVILFTLFLGLRIGETLGLPWNKINMDKGIVEISQQAVSYYDGIKTVQEIVPYTKDKNKRILPLPDIAVDLLKKQKELYIENSDNLVFTEIDGSEILYASFYYRFNKIMESIGRSDIAPHDLRHTMASTLLYKTKDIFLLKEFLGHESIYATEFYPTATLEERQETASALDAYFASYLEEAFNLKRGRFTC